MSSLENKANQLIAEAEKKLTPFSFLNIFFNKSSKYEQASECYQRAANLLKVSKNWSKAASCFAQCAEIHIEINNQYDAALNYVNAASCYKKCNPQAAIECLMKAIEVYTDMGRFVMAAKHHQTIAEIYELQLVDIKNALNHYEQASDYFKSEENIASSEMCSLKIAHYCAIFEDYQKAIEIYQQIALAHIGGTLLKYNVQVYLFKAALCHLCADILCGKHVIQKYVELFPMFEDSNECKFLVEIVDRIEEDDLNGYIASKFEFTSKFRCDELVRTLLIRLEKILSNGVDML
ncbi:alpha-soluble NSF attachment protein-like [Coccinella septempunctata]|uniref:alpha-soluble NSF attachment protein-like n=1 Tax=Coccinella septempunctata TaxID=41139 RepID=UPI001D077D9C|nr:alpha-soluble NSF attachment protein-like [Coccinella septempunctata]